MLRDFFSIVADFFVLAIIPSIIALIITLIYQIKTKRQPPIIALYISLAVAIGTFIAGCAIIFIIFAWLAYIILIIIIIVIVVAIIIAIIDG